MQPIDFVIARMAPPAPDFVNYLPPLVQMAAGAVRPMHQVMKAYRSGKGSHIHTTQRTSGTARPA